MSNKQSGIMVGLPNINPADYIKEAVKEALQAQELCTSVVARLCALEQENNRLHELLKSVGISTEPIIPKAYKLSPTVADFFECRACGRRLMIEKGLPHDACPNCGSKRIKQISFKKAMGEDEDN